MRNQFIVTPIHKNCIHARYELVRTNVDNSNSWLNIQVLYERGSASVYGDENLPNAGDIIAQCSLPGNLSNVILVTFDFSEDISETERTHIKQEWDKAGTEWMDNSWEREDSYIVITGPFTVDLCDENGEVIAKDIKLIGQPAVFAGINDQWPVDTKLKENN